MAVHLVGSGAHGIVDVKSTLTFTTTLPVAWRGETVDCPRKGRIDLSVCADCRHLKAWQTTPEPLLYCNVDDGEPVSDWMRPKPPATTVHARAPAADEYARARGVHHLLVFDPRRRLAGVVCRCDLGSAGDRAVGEIMSAEVFAVEPSTSLGVAAAAMRELHIHCLAVISGPLVLGILTRHDLDRAGVPR